MNLFSASEIGPGVGRSVGWSESAQVCHVSDRVSWSVTPTRKFKNLVKRLKDRFPDRLWRPKRVGRSVGPTNSNFASPRCARRVGRSGEPSRDRENLKKRVGRRERREHIQLRTAGCPAGASYERAWPDGGLRRLGWAGGSLVASRRAMEA